jgi:hypothetical protein
MQVIGVGRMPMHREERRAPDRQEIHRKRANVSALQPHGPIDINHNEYQVTG